VVDFLKNNTILNRTKNLQNLSVEEIFLILRSLDKSYFLLDKK